MIKINQKMNPFIPQTIKVQYYNSLHTQIQQVTYSPWVRFYLIIIQIAYMFKRTQSFHDKNDNKEKGETMNNLNENQVAKKEEDKRSQFSTFSYKGSKRKKLPRAVEEKIKNSSKEEFSGANLSLMMSSKIRKLEGKKFACRMCEEDYENEFRVELSNCGHCFCNSCMQHYALYKIQRFEEVICPEEGCENPMDMRGSFYAGLPVQAKKKAKKVMAFYSTLKNPNLRLCPRNECDNGVISLEEGEKVVTCDTCQKQFCGKCLFPVHEGDCEKNQVEFFQKNLRYRQCVKCKMVIERSEGCRRMKCRCGYEFCYICGIKWPGYEHTHTAQEEFGVNGDLNYNVGGVRPPPPPPPRQNPEGCMFLLYVLRVILFGFPIFLVLLTLRSALQLIVICASLYVTIWYGLCGMSCRLAEQCEVPCPIFVLFLPIFMIAGVFAAIGHYFSQQFCQQGDWYCESVSAIVECCLCP